MIESSTPAVVGSNDRLGPLPTPTDMLQVMWRGDREFARPVGDYYTADQMRAYAAEQVAAERERCAQVVRDFPHWLGAQAKRELLLALKPNAL